MRLLLDTHAPLWWFDDAPKLSPRLRTEMREDKSEVFVSVVSVWEIAIKYQINKLRVPYELIGDLDAIVRAEGFIPLDITLRHAQAAGALPGPHRDPFDRLLIAQALAEGLTLVSNERVFDGYGVERVW